MLKLTNSTSTTLTAGATIPLNVKFNTNNNTGYNTTTNAVIINNSGYYSLNYEIVLSVATASDLSLELYANGVAIPETKVTETFDADDVRTIVINDIQKIIPNLTDTTKVNITCVTDTACTLTNANVSVYMIR